jgi:hypothetical protein
MLKLLASTQSKKKKPATRASQARREGETKAAFLKHLNTYASTLI